MEARGPIRSKRCLTGIVRAKYYTTVYVANFLWGRAKNATGDCRLAKNIMQTDAAVSDHYNETFPLWVIRGHFAMREQCPLYPPKADMCGATTHVR
jgi:hypothetical protein